MRNQPTVTLLLCAVLSSCSGGTVQKANVPDKVTSLQVPHTTAECDELAKKVAPKGKCGKTLWFSTHLSEMASREKELASFTPERRYLVKGFTYNHLLHAISPGARKRWLTDSNALDFEQCPQLEASFCRIATLAEQKLPQFLPNTKKYPAHAEEKLMKGAIKDLEAHTIFYLGLQEENWLIDKNGLGLPISRFKHGMAWVRYAPDDHPYCRAYYINIVQDYAGGGSYGDSVANFIEEELVGCPPN